MKGGEEYNGDQEEGSCKKSEEDHEKKITYSAMGCSFEP
jgi:hypothetical protein